MKNTFTLVLVFLSAWSYAQEKANTKFQAGVSYSLTNDDELFNNPISGYVNYLLSFTRLLFYNMPNNFQI